MKYKIERELELDGLWGASYGFNKRRMNLSLSSQLKECDSDIRWPQPAAA